MSIRVMTRVWDRAGAGGGELLVLLALADFADDDGYSYPTPAQVAHKARLSDRQVRTVLQCLEARGELAYHIGRGRSARSWFVVLTGLDDDVKTARRAGLTERINRQSVPDLSPQFRKKLPEISSGLRAKSGSLQQLNPEVFSLNPEVSSNENAVFALPEGLNALPNRHDPSGDPPPPAPSSADVAAAPPIAAGGGGEDKRQRQPAAGPGRNPPPQLSPGERYLHDEGFSSWAVRQFGHLPVDVLRADVERRRKAGAQKGGIVEAWKLAPPTAAPPRPPASAEAILAHPDPKVRERWLKRLRAEGADRAAVLAAFFEEYPDAQLQRPARAGPPLRPG